jgi:hypothetical protein
MSALSGRPHVSVLPVVLLVALAFALGSVGTASAAALTKGAVKKIAAKVVAKQAPSLSVKHATSADSALTATTATSAANADKVGGQTAAQLGVRPIVFTLPKGQVNPSVKSWTVSGVPAGTYLATFHMIFAATTTAITFGECSLINQTTDDYPITDYQIAAPSRVPTLSGTGYATVAPGDHLVLSCDANDGWMPAYDGHVTLTPVASATPGTLTAP